MNILSKFQIILLAALVAVANAGLLGHPAPAVYTAAVPVTYATTSSLYKNIAPASTYGAEYGYNYGVKESVSTPVVHTAVGAPIVKTLATQTVEAPVVRTVAYSAHPTPYQHYSHAAPAIAYSAAPALTYAAAPAISTYAAAPAVRYAAAPAISYAAAPLASAYGYSYGQQYSHQVPYAYQSRYLSGLYH